MKRIITGIVVFLLLLSAVGCGQSTPVAGSEPGNATTAGTTTTAAAAPHVTETVQGNMKTYDKMSDGTFRCNGQTYQYCLEITGRMHSAAKDSTFTYLSNLPEISFDRAWKAAGLSSDRNDYFDPGDAVLVDMK